MRTSLAITALFTTPLFAVVACSPGAPVKPVKGTVVQKEYDAPQRTIKRVPVKETSCTTRNKKRTCTTTITRYRLVTTTVKAECYELDIRLPDGSETEICDKDAYRVLPVHSHYNSSVDYSQQVWQ